MSASHINLLRKDCRNPSASLIFSFFLLAYLVFGLSSPVISVAVAGHEDLCGNRLRYPFGSPVKEGHHRKRQRYGGRHQTIQQVCQARLWAVHRAYNAPGRHCGATRCVCTLTLYGMTVTDNVQQRCYVFINKQDLAWTCAFQKCILLLLNLSVCVHFKLCDFRGTFLLFWSSSCRWWQYGSHWSDCTACSQSAREGKRHPTHSFM